MAPASWEPTGGPPESIEENWLFKLRRQRFRSRVSGKEHGFYVIGLADAVHVIAVTPDRRVVLVRQFRAGSGCDSLETPGGLVEPGEDAAEAGVRELLEETGYAGDPPIRLGTVWSNPSLVTSRITTIVVENARAVGDSAFDEHEELTLETVDEADLPGLIGRGEIDHALVVQGLLGWMAWRDGRLEFGRGSQ